MSVAFAVCGLLYGAFFVRVFQQYTTVFAVLLLGIGLIIAYFAESFAMMCLASVVFGLGFPMFNDAIVQALGRTVRRENAIPVITSYFFAVSGIGQYLSSLVTPAISAALFRAISGETGSSPQYASQRGLLSPASYRSSSRERRRRPDSARGVVLSICGGYERIKCG